MLKRLALIVVVLVVAAAGALGALAWWAWQGLNRPFVVPGGSEGVVVNVESGQSARTILAMLETKGLLTNQTVARVYLSRVLEDPALRAGEYRFTGETDAIGVLDKLIRGEIVTYPMTVIEGLTKEETIDRIVDAGFGNRARLLELVSSPELVADIDPLASDLEGYLFPDTYSFARTASESEIVETMVQTFRQRWGTHVAPRLAPQESRSGASPEDENPDKGPVRDPLSLRELVTLASIIETEAQLDEERPVIASVYANRLRIGMGLYADPTIVYALKLRGEWDGNIRRTDLTLDSPYNTYVYPGLPPGPIASPGAKSLVAAADPADTDYLYFVSRNDGSHVFSRTLAEHNRNVDRWQRRYWREARAGKQAVP